MTDSDQDDQIGRASNHADIYPGKYYLGGFRQNSQVATRKKAGEKLARSMLKTICCIENYYSAFFSAIPALVFRTVNLVSAPIPKLSTSSFDWKLVGDTRAGHAESGEYGQAIEAANSKHLSHPL